MEELRGRWPEKIKIDRLKTIAGLMDVVLIEKPLEGSAEINTTPINDLVDFVEFQGLLLSSVLNGNITVIDYSKIELATKALDAFIGSQNIVGQFIHMNESEYIRVYIAFETQFNLNDNPALEQKVESLFRYVLGIVNEMVK